MPRRAVSPRTIMANTSLNPRGDNHWIFQRARYSARTAASTAAASPRGGCFKTAASAVPVYSG